MTRNVGALISGNRVSHRTGIKIGEMSLLAVPILPEGLAGLSPRRGDVAQPACCDVCGRSDLRDRLLRIRTALTKGFVEMA